MNAIPPVSAVRSPRSHVPAGSSSIAFAEFGTARNPEYDSGVIEWLFVTIPPRRSISCIG